MKIAIGWKISMGYIRIGYEETFYTSVVVGTIEEVKPRFDELWEELFNEHGNIQNAEIKLMTKEV